MLTLMIFKGKAKENDRQRVFMLTLPTAILDAFTMKLLLKCSTIPLFPQNVLLLLYLWGRRDLP